MELPNLLSNLTSNTDAIEILPIKFVVITGISQSQKGTPLQKVAHGQKISKTTKSQEFTSIA